MSSNRFDENDDQRPDVPLEHHPAATGIGVAAGGVVGGLVGSAIAGKQGGLWGVIAGAVVGGLAGDTVSEDLIALEQQAAEILGEAPSEDELPAHYSWDELQALSKPQ